MVQEAAAPEYDVVLADWDHPEALADYLGKEGWALEERYRTWRPDGTVSFTVCLMVPAAGRGGGNPVAVRAGLQPCESRHCSQ